MYSNIQDIPVASITENSTRILNTYHVLVTVGKERNQSFGLQRVHNLLERDIYIKILVVKSHRICGQ
jgi:hypothetical protein